MQSVHPPRTAEEVGRLDTQMIEQRILPLLPIGTPDRFIAVDVNSGEYEVDDDDYAAVHRLHARVPGAEVWLGGTGHLAMDRLGLR